MDRLKPNQARAAASTLAEAFSDHPLMHILAPDQKRRADVAKWFFGAAINYGLRYNGEVSCNDDASAAAIWFPPGHTHLSPVRMLRAGMGAMPFKAGINGTLRFVRAMPVTEAFHKAVDGPHWYLLAIGTRPDVQGTGLGGALVELGTAQADKAKIPCYLETATESNVAFYRKRGFEVTGEAEIYGFTPTFARVAKRNC
jgi:ribosomal protein S18 acetylase RimI-like enzyme